VAGEAIEEKKAKLAVKKQAIGAKRYNVMKFNDAIKN